VISREFVNPFAKTGGKASILARLANSRLSAPFAACFLGTDAQKTGIAIWMGGLFLQTGGRVSELPRDLGIYRWGGNAEAQRARRARYRVRGRAALPRACRSVGKRLPPVAWLATGRSTSWRGHPFDPQRRFCPSVSSAPTSGRVPFATHRFHMASRTNRPAFDPPDSIHQIRLDPTRAILPDWLHPIRRTRFDPLGTSACAAIVAGQLFHPVHGTW
jgi:hypothetical protein